MDSVQFSRFAVWLCGFRAAIVQIGAILEPEESVRNFSFEREDSGVVAGDFAARNTKRGIENI